MRSETLKRRIPQFYNTINYGVNGKRNPRRKLKQIILKPDKWYTTIIMDKFTERDWRTRRETREGGLAWLLAKNIVKYVWTMWA